MKIDPRITTYIERAETFAQPILDEIRERVHEFCPEVEETLKWQCPHFMYKGKILCSAASFKKHCAFGFWLAPLMKTDHFNTGAMGDFGKMSGVKDLPTREIFQAMILEAMALIDAGKTVPKKVANIEIPDEILDVLKHDPQAEANFKSFPPSHQKEYIEWIQEAKTEATRQKRKDQMLEMVAEGKSRQWKYMNKKSGR